MDQLKIGDILAFCAELRQKGMTMEEIKALPMQILHTAFTLYLLSYTGSMKR